MIYDLQNEEREEATQQQQEERSTAPHGTARHGILTTA
jgi:hypothetical protein